MVQIVQLHCLHSHSTGMAKKITIKAVDLFTPTIFYQSENGTLSTKEKQMLTTTEMTCLRKAAGMVTMDMIG